MHEHVTTAQELKMGWGGTGGPEPAQARGFGGLQPSCAQPWARKLARKTLPFRNSHPKDGFYYHTDHIFSDYKNNHLLVTNATHPENADRAQQTFVTGRTSLRCPQPALCIRPEFFPLKSIFKGRNRRPSSRCFEIPSSGLGG